MTGLASQLGLESTLGKVMPASEEKLCPNCLAISWNSDKDESNPDRLETAKRWLDHHETLGELERACEAGCPLCQTLFLLSIYQDASLTSYDPLPWKFFRYMGKYSLASWPKLGYGETHDWFIRADQVNQLSQSITTVKWLSPLTMNDDLKALLDESINPWIKACTRLEKHAMCPSILPHELISYQLPTRLIDVGAGVGSTVRLFNTSDLSEKDRSPYLILSYCWGAGNASARTTSRNLIERLNEMKTETLPSTTTDAITLT